MDACKFSRACACPCLSEDARKAFVYIYDTLVTRAEGCVTLHFKDANVAYLCIM